MNRGLKPTVKGLRHRAKERRVARGKAQGRRTARGTRRAAKLKAQDGTKDTGRKAQD